jgi:hypothetical protein
MTMIEDCFPGSYAVAPERIAPVIAEHERCTFVPIRPEYPGHLIAKRDLPRLVRLGKHETPLDVGLPHVDPSRG